MPEMREQLNNFPILQNVFDKLSRTFPGQELVFSFDRQELAVRVPKEHLLKILTFLKDDCGFNTLSDVIGLDNLNIRKEGEKRFAILYQLYMFPAVQRLRVRVEIGENEVADSIVPLYPAADWAEREIYDMFGIRFAHHPNLRRIYMDDEWDGFPLRKDYPLEGKK